MRSGSGSWDLGPIPGLPARSSGSEEAYHAKSPWNKSVNSPGRIRPDGISVFSGQTIHRNLSSGHAQYFNQGCAHLKFVL